jgi:hypothetical protein
VVWLLLFFLARIFGARTIFSQNSPDRMEGDWNPRGLPVRELWLPTFEGLKLYA